MALRDLVDTECGGVNSLVQLTSHFIQDQGLKEEGFRNAIPPTDAFANSDPDQLAQQFLEETSGPSRQTFRMDSLLAEMRDLEGRSSAAPVQSLPVSQLAIQDDINCWAEQYLESGKHFQEENQSSIWSPETEKLQDVSVLGFGLQDEVSELGFGPNWASEYLESHEESQDAELDTALLNSQDFTQESNNSDIMLAANDLLANVDDPRFHYSKFMQFMKLIGEGEVTIDPDGVVTDGGVADSWSKEYSKQAAASQNGEKLLNESDEAANLSDESFTNKLWDKLSQKWGEMSHAGEGEAHPWNSEFVDYSAIFKDYNFRQENPMQALQNALEEGQKKLEAGDLPSAVLCFEAAVQAEPDNPLAWQLLGTTQAENEQDPQAIAALKKCIHVDPNNMIALMALAVSFTNENYQNQACQVLKEWLRVNPKYNDLVRTDKDNFKISDLSSLMTRDLHDEVRELYIVAARRNPLTIDPDVQTGLGVLFNLSSEYDKAVDCFRTALQVRPDDSQLWNRLGATLANGDRSEEAVDAYHNALRLFPGYVRARYNVGITCVHLGANKEAAEHLLTALNQQASGRGVAGESLLTMSDTIWTTLRLVVSLLDRSDLIPAINDRDLNKLNKELGLE